MPKAKRKRIAPSGYGIVKAHTRQYAQGTRHFGRYGVKDHIPPKMMLNMVKRTYNEVLRQTDTDFKVSDIFYVRGY